MSCVDACAVRRAASVRRCVTVWRTARCTQSSVDFTFLSESDANGQSNVTFASNVATVICARSRPEVRTRSSAVSKTLWMHRRTQRAGTHVGHWTWGGVGWCCGGFTFRTLPPKLPRTVNHTHFQLLATVVWARLVSNSGQQWRLHRLHLTSVPHARLHDARGRSRRSWPSHDATRAAA